jgi:hypothetical protein
MISFSLLVSLSLLQCPEIKVHNYNLQSKYADNSIEAYTTTMLLRLFVIHLPLGVMLLSLIVFSQVPTDVAAAVEAIDKELEENIITDDEIYPSDDTPFELSFDIILPFP